MSIFDQFSEKFLKDDSRKRHVKLDSEEWQFREREEILTKPQKNFYIFYLVSVLCFLGLVAQLLNLQISHGSFNRHLAEGNRVREREISAPRGIIYDRTGIALVSNQGSFSLEIYPLDLPKDKDQKELYFDKLSQIIKISVSEIKTKINDKNVSQAGAVLLRENIDRDSAMLLETKLVNLPGVVISTKSIRNYKSSLGFSPILGYVGKINPEELKNKPYYKLNEEIGKEGLEKVYEEYLKGKRGFDSIEVDAVGRSQRLLSKQIPQVGDNLTLSLDFGLEEEIFKLLQDQLEKTGATAASAVAIDPKTGGVLAMVSLPTYDNNVFAKGITTEEYQKLLNDKAKPLFNRSVSGLYPPGSTIKPMISAAALQDENITDKTTLDTSIGVIKIGSWSFPDWEVHGMADVKKAIAESNDIFFYALGGGWDKIKGLGPDRMKYYLEKFGYGQILGIDIPGEVEGTVPTPAWKKKVIKSPWYLGDTYHMAIGQGYVLSTPLQVASTTATIANGGQVLKPYLVEKITDQNGREIKKTEKTVLRSGFISSENIKTVQEGMRQTVTNGSASILKNIPVEVAAKTGTAQFGTDDKTHSWMISYAPYNNPEIALAVIVEGGGEGWQIAGGVTKGALEYYFKK